MIPDLSRRIQKLFPNVDLFSSVIVQDDGFGPYIKKWDAALGSQPTLAELLAVDVRATAEEKTEAVLISKRVLAALVFCADTRTQPQWVIDAITNAKAAITTARS